MIPAKLSVKKQQTLAQYVCKQHFSSKKYQFQLLNVCRLQVRQTERQTGAQMMLGTEGERGGVVVHIPGSHSACWQVVLLCLLALPAPRVYVLGFSPPSLSKYFLMPLKNVRMLLKKWSSHIQ